MGTKDLVHKILTKRIASKVAFDINDPQFKQFLTKLNLERISAGKKPFVNFKRVKPGVMKTLWDASRSEKLPTVEPEVTKGIFKKTAEHLWKHKKSYVTGAVAAGVTGLVAWKKLKDRSTKINESERIKQISEDKPWNKGHAVLGAGIGLLVLTPFAVNYIRNRRKKDKTNIIDGGMDESGI